MFTCTHVLASSIVANVYGVMAKSPLLLVAITVLATGGETELTVSKPLVVLYAVFACIETIVPLSRLAANMRLGWTV